MKKNFIHFVEQLHYHSDCFREHQLCALLESNDIKTLKDSGFLKRGGDLKEILCKSCDNDHFLPVRVEDGKSYYLCPYEDTARNYLTLHDIATWNFDTESFLQQLSFKLEIEANIEKMEVQDMWQIGSFSKDDTRHNCYYYKGKRFNEALDFIQDQPPQMRRYVIFTNKQETASSLTSSHNWLPIEIKELVELKNGRLIFNKKYFNDFLIHGFRSVFFNPKNGDLTVNGRPISRITPTSPEYYFAELLWKNFNEPVSHKKIEAYIYEKTKKTYVDTAGNLCYKQKKKIKSTSEEPKLIDEIFQTTTDLDGNNAFIMRNPS